MVSEIVSAAAVFESAPAAAAAAMLAALPRKVLAEVVCCVKKRQRVERGLPLWTYQPAMQPKWDATCSGPVRITR